MIIKLSPLLFLSSMLVTTASAQERTGNPCVDGEIYYGKFYTIQDESGKYWAEPGLPYHDNGYRDVSLVDGADLDGAHWKFDNLGTNPSRSWRIKNRHSSFFIEEQDGRALTRPQVKLVAQPDGSAKWAYSLSFAANFRVKCGGEQMVLKDAWIFGGSSCGPISVQGKTTTVLV